MLRRHWDQRPKKLERQDGLAFAYRLGAKLGIDDPEQWLELSDQENVNQWRAHYRLEPFGGEQRLLAIIASQLWLLCCAEYTDRKALAKSVDELTKMFMPGDWVGQADDKKKPSAHDQMQAVRDQLAKVFPA